jgi:hypothetical protein
LENKDKAKKILAKIVPSIINNNKRVTKRSQTLTNRNISTHEMIVPSTTNANTNAPLGDENPKALALALAGPDRIYWQKAWDLELERCAARHLFDILPEEEQTDDYYSIIKAIKSVYACRASLKANGNWKYRVRLCLFPSLRQRLLLRLYICSYSKISNNIVNHTDPCSIARVAYKSY